MTFRRLLMALGCAGLGAAVAPLVAMSDSPRAISLPTTVTTQTKLAAPSLPTTVSAPVVGTVPVPNVTSTVSKVTSTVKNVTSSLPKVTSTVQHLTSTVSSVVNNPTKLPTTTSKLPPATLPGGGTPLPGGTSGGGSTTTSPLKPVIDTVNNVVTTVTGGKPIPGITPGTNPGSGPGGTNATAASRHTVGDA